MVFNTTGKGRGEQGGNDDENTKTLVIPALAQETIP